MRKKKEKQKMGCGERIVRAVRNLLIIIVVFTVFAMWSSQNDQSEGKKPDAEAGVSPAVTCTPVETPENTAAPTPTVAQKETATPKPTNTPKPTKAPTPTPTAEPDTLQGWAEYVANSVYGSFDPKYSNLISVECEQVDGESAPMIIVNAKYPDTFMRDNDDRMGQFLYRAMNMTWKLNDLAKEGKIEYGSVYIHGKTTFVDKYGNETEGDAAAIRIKASEAEKVNWSYSTFTSEMMPGIAVSFMIHPIIRDGLSYEYLNKIR